MRYGGQDARLGVTDIGSMTGLAPRTVKAALAVLLQQNLLVRVGRYKRLRINLTVQDAALVRADVSSPSAGTTEAAGGAGKFAPRKCSQACTSPTCINVSLGNDNDKAIPFTGKQQALIADLFAEATELLGSDATLLTVPTPQAIRMGLEVPITYGAVYANIISTGHPVDAGAFTRAVLALRRDVRIQGRDI
jgi:hypothetical protein